MSTTTQAAFAPKTETDDDKTGFGLFMQRVDIALSPITGGMGASDFADALWMDLFTDTQGEATDCQIFETLADQDEIFAQMLFLYDNPDPDPDPKGPTMESIIGDNIEKAETAAAELDGQTPSNEVLQAREEIRAASAINPSLGIIAAMTAVAGSRKPYSATEQAAVKVTIEFFDREPRTFRAGDYAKHYRNQSFREEGRARSDLESMAARIDQARIIANNLIPRAPENAEVIKAAFDAHAAKHIEFSLAYIANNSRLASAMITGPSNFPQRRMEKLNRQHHTKYDRLQEHVKIGEKRLRRAAFPHGDPQQGIRSDNPDAIALLKKKIETLEGNQEYYKKANKDVRAAMKTADPVAAMIEKGYSEEMAKGYTAFEYSWMKNRAFDSYVTTNNLANIKRLKGRLAALEKTKTTETQAKAYELENGETFEVVRNSDAMRIQLLFSGKPSGLTRAALKSKGFKWAPSQKAWQRHLNNNGEYALKRVLKELDAKESEEA